MSSRQCGSCSLCCKVLDVPAVYKPAGQWCRHFKAGAGCSIHQLRPKPCRDFACLWLKDSGLDDAWKPSTAKFVLADSPEGDALLIHVDPNQKNAWRLEPYHRVLRQLADRLMRENKLLIVMEPKRRFAVTPDREIELGDPALPLTWEITVSERAGRTDFHIEFERSARQPSAPTPTFVPAGPATVAPAAEKPTATFTFSAPR